MFAEQGSLIPATKYLEQVTEDFWLQRNRAVSPWTLEMFTQEMTNTRILIPDLNPDTKSAPNYLLAGRDYPSQGDE